jgi:hypothetical protein
MDRSANRGVYTVASYQRSWSTDDLALVVVLGTVAGAEELVLGGVPRHHASQVGADGVDPVGGQRLVLLHHQVRGVTLHAHAFSRFIVSFIRPLITWIIYIGDLFLFARWWMMDGWWTLSPCASVRSLGPCVLSHSSTLMSLPSLSLATVPAPVLPDLEKSISQRSSSSPLESEPQQL